MLRSWTVVIALSALLTACGGDADPPQPTDQTTTEPPPPVVLAPTITALSTQAMTVTVGQTASFSVTATGTGPLTYQWSRNGASIAGATGASYTTPATVAGDSGATFTVTVTNSAGSVTSNPVTLTVTAPLTFAITQQPQSVTVVAGATASFTAAASCSSNDLTWIWQRSADGTTFTAIGGATMDSFSLTTAASDNAAQFRAVATCHAQTLNTSAAALTVTTPAPPPTSSATLTLLPLVGLRDQADLQGLFGIDRDAAGSYTVTTQTHIKRLTQDLSTVNLIAGGQFTGSTDGAAASATFNGPTAVAHDSSGNLYVADTGNFTIRRIGTDGTVTTLAGAVGMSATTDGNGAAARFTYINAMVMGPDGDLYLAESNANVIRRVTTAGVVTTYAGSGAAGYADNAAPLAAQFNRPTSLAALPNGDLLIGDAGNNRIRRIVRSGTAAGAVDTWAGSGAGSPESDGVGTAAVILQPEAMTLNGSTLALREISGAMRLIDTGTKTVTTLIAATSAGVDYTGYQDGPAALAQVAAQGGIAPVSDGSFILADANSALRTLTATGTVATFAARVASGVTPTGVGVLAQMPLCLSNSAGDGNALAVDSAGNVVIADGCQKEVRRIAASGVVTLAAGVPNTNGSATDGIGSEAHFASLGTSIGIDSHDVIFVSDYSAIRRIGTDNNTTLFSGNLSTPGAVDGNAATALFNAAFGITFGASGDMFVADFGNAAIRRVDTSGNVTTYAGVLGDREHVDGPIASARFYGPRDMKFAPDGSMYVSDGGPSSVNSGSLRIISSDGSTVSSPGLPADVRVMAIDAVGTLYIGNDSGLYSLAPGSTTPTLLIAGGSASVTVGSSPQLAEVSGLALLGPKKLVLKSASALYIATLP